MPGPVDGFDQDEGSCESDAGAEVRGGLFTAQDDALEAFELSDGLFDPRPFPVEYFFLWSQRIHWNRRNRFLCDSMNSINAIPEIVDRF